MDTPLKSNPRAEEETEPNEELESSEAEEEPQMKPPEGLRLSVRTVPILWRTPRPVARTRLPFASTLPANGHCLSS